MPMIVSQGSAMSRILLLGGTSEASQLARLLADAGLDAVFSYAGRTEAPVGQPLPLRIGGFGGVEGLAAYLRDQAITHLIDATHPFAEQISRNAIAAAAETGVPILSLQRPAWQAGPGDRWTHVPDIPAAVSALNGAPRRVMLAVGRMHLDEFAPNPQHFYLLRLVDPPKTPPPFAEDHVIVDRGPFTAEGDRALMEEHGIDMVVSKNAGGSGASAKLDAARALGLPVVMIDRPALPARREVATPQEVLDWVAHAGTDRGV